MINNWLVVGLITLTTSVTELVIHPKEFKIY